MIYITRIHTMYQVSIYELTTYSLTESSKWAYVVVLPYPHFQYPPHFTTFLGKSFMSGEERMSLPL